MKINKLFLKPIDRSIEGVIKADDLAGLALEVEEYVITNEIARELSQLYSEYNDYRGANGVWISGFFGSGKSHLLKMLALLLENRIVDGKPTLEYFLPKCEEDALLKGQMRKAVEIPSHSILFNIDQKADTISKKECDAILAVFVKVFDEMCGYYGKQGYIAKLERDLDDKGKYESFKDEYKKIAGVVWEDGREKIILEKGNVAKAYAQVTGESADSHKNIVDAFREDYKLSIEDFAEQVHAYILKQPKGFRLNFFVDEVGQFIAENVKFMTNLQTIAESLATKCNGQSWVFVTAQENMDTILGEMSRQQTTDFSKIQDRFKTRMKLTSKNVDEVIQIRLLAKNEEGITTTTKIYQEWKNNFGTLFDFADGATKYQNFRDEGHFVNCYPFIPYQFTLFQKSIETLSAHDAFEGRHRSVGERSMLGVFQEVAKRIADKEVKELASFDLMFEGIRSALKTQFQQAIINAENHMGNPFAVKVLKALFLVKYIKGFNATPRNMRVLLQDKLDADLPKLEKEIKAALDALEQETYIQRNGETYEYLTDEEKDIEKEIKDTSVDSDEIAKTLEELLFTSIIRENKIQFEATGQDFPFTRKIDDRNMSKEQELAIHFITPFHSHIDDIDILKAHSLDKPELMVLLPNDARFMRDLLLYKQTDKYIRIHSADAQSETAQTIISNKAFQRNEREVQLRDHAQELVSRSKIIVSGEETPITSQEPKTKIAKGFEALATRVYPNLRMLYSTHYKEENIEKYLTITKDSLLSGDAVQPGEAEQEALSIIQSNKRAGTRTTIKNLVETLEKRPYGWYLAAIQCILALLAGKGKIEARSDANILEGDDLARALKNTHGFGNVIIEPQPEFTPAQIRKLKDFFTDFFDHPTSAADAKILTNETKEAFTQLLNQLNTYHAQIRQYPFLSALQAPIVAIEQLTGKSSSYFIEELPDASDALFDFKEKVIDPITRFMNSPNKGIFDQAVLFMQEQKTNFDALSNGRAKQLQEILTDPDCYKTNRMIEAKKLIEGLQKDIQALITEEKKAALQQVAQIENQINGLPEFGKIDSSQKEELDGSFKAVRYAIEAEHLIPVIRDRVGRYESAGRSELLGKITAWTQSSKEQPVEYITTKSLDIHFTKPYLADGKDIEEYLDLVRQAMLKAIKANKRIQL